jgi:hypothetical protein
LPAAELAEDKTSEKIFMQANPAIKEEIYIFLNDPISLQ